MISVLGFVLWCVLLVVSMTGIVVAQKRSKRIDKGMESAASSSLPQIEDIARRREQKKLERKGVDPQVAAARPAHR